MAELGGSAEVIAVAGCGDHGPGPAAMTVTVLIVDDHPVVREGMRGMLAGEPDIEVIGEAGDGAEAAVMASSLKPDVVLMDLRMPGTDGVEATKLIVSASEPGRGRRSGCDHLRHRSRHTEGRRSRGARGTF